MPKILSLKKAQPTVPSKNQKSITQFFKSANTASDQQQQKSPAKTQPACIKQNEKKSIKRKALSQVELETVVIDDDESTTNNHGQNSTPKHVYHSPKKFKRDQETLQTSTISKKSPDKENNISKKFPRQSGDHSDGTNDFNNTEHLQNECVDNERLPLTPIKVYLNGENNEVNGKLSSDNINDNTNEQKSSPTKNENHVQVIENKNTPKKVLNFDNCRQNSVHSVKKKNSPLKSPLKSLTCASRVAVLKTPEKLTQEELSPSKSGSTVKTLEFSPGALDEFGDQWDVEDVGEDCTENLDLTTMQRCEVTSVTQLQGRLELRLKNSHNNRGTCCVEGVWLDTPLSPGEIISVIACRNSSGQFYVGNSAGLIVFRPDHLVSSTSVVAGVFCKRKAVLQERWRGLDAGNTAMTIGILVHELAQKALTQNIMDVATLHMETDRIIKESLQMLYDAGLGEEETKSNMLQYITPLADFMQTYVAKSPLSKQTQKDQWKGHIEKVLDIEENLCCPPLGLKGKIDATIQVTIHERKGRNRAVVPLELKSGKASVSAEHRGQLVLYGMMLSLLRGEDPTTASNSGLLLYLKERVDLREVSCGYPERRDLVLLRNQLVQHLTTGRPLLPDNMADIEDAACFQQQLPEPINHGTACAKCPYLTLCSLHLWHTEGPSVSASHPLAKLRDEALGHLSPGHVQYFLRWAALLRAEEAGQLTRAPLHALWTDSADARSKRGTCASNLKLKSVESSGDRYLHVFERQIKEIETLKAGSKSSNGPQEGEFSIVSIDGRPWVAAGVVAVVKGTQISILLERDLSRRLNQDTAYHIDTYESYATTVHNLTNLGVLLENSDRSTRLRRLIIDKQPPEFEKKLPREVGRLGSKLMKTLNIEQQRAVLKALAAKDYALLQGLPGTGKTQTISVLIQMLVGLKQRVLVTAHTHSAVDTVLSRLPPHLKVMRLGSSARVATSLLDRCEQHLVGKCEIVKQLEELFESMEVVGVTCLGAAHAMLSRTSFDVCIVDEATQVVQSTVLRPLFAAGRFLLVGDPEQLPPIVRTPVARRLGMEESLFHLLMREDATSTLQLQYRMNQPLADLANKVAYDNRLKCADQKVANAMLRINIELLSSQPSWVQKACSPEPENAALFLDMVTTDVLNKSSKSCTNVDEACIVMALVEALLQGGVNPSDIGVIAPYRDQVTLLRSVLSPRGIEGSTVDQFQGRDKAVILYSCTKKEEKDEDRKIKEGEILNDQRRLAVSVTRAKHKLLTVGNSRALQRYAPLQRLIQHSTVLTLDKNVVDSIVYKYKKEFV